VDESAKNQFGDQVRKMNIALHYVANDMVKAKQMVSGSYRDLIVFKGRFSSSSLYGCFIIFFNKVYSKVTDSTFVLSPDYALGGINTTQDWKTFEKDMVDHQKNSETSRASQDIKDKIDRSFTLAICNELSRLLERNDMIQVQHVIQKILQESTGFKRVDLKVELQELSSLEMELDSITSRKVDAKTLSGAATETKKPETTETPADADPEVGKNGVKLIVKSTLNLSPIKGKHISQIVPGDRVMITMIEQNNQTLQIAQAFKAFNKEQNRILPVPARVVSIKYIDGLGYKVFAMIAKGVLAQVIEEETNIKVALDPAATPAAADKEDAKGPGLPAIIGLVAVFIVLLMIIVFIVF